MTARLLPLMALLTALLLSACGMAIGDDCDNDSQCPSGAYCDRTMPGGYCTMANCRAGDCPDGSVCVEFKNGESYCMERCSDNGDCRDDYACITDVGLWPFCSVLE